MPVFSEETTETIVEINNFVAREECMWLYNVSLLFITDQKGNLEETEGSGKSELHSTDLHLEG